MRKQQTVISDETVPCEICQEVAVPLKGQRPCANCRERFERTGSYYCY